MGEEGRNVRGLAFACPPAGEPPSRRDTRRNAPQRHRMSAPRTGDLVTLAHQIGILRIYRHKVP